jgi:hypothetical protein
MSSLPSAVHPKDGDVPEFPFVMDSELERTVRASLEATASRTGRLFGGGRRVTLESDAGAREAASSFTASDEASSRPYAN